MLFVGGRSAGPACEGPSRRDSSLSPVGPQVPKKVPSGLIHDWVGAVFIPNVSLNDVQQVVRDYARYKDLYQPNVIDSKVIATGRRERSLFDAPPEQIATSEDGVRRRL